MAFIDSTDLQRYFSTADRMNRYASQAADNITYAISVATARISSAAKNVFTAASVDGATVGTTSAEVKQMACALAAGVLTGGGQERPETIQRDFESAEKWLGILAGGKVHVPEWTRIAGNEDGTSTTAHRKPRQRVFDRDDPDAEFDSRDPRF